VHFPVTVDLTISGPITLFFDQDGNIVRIQTHGVEQDVFSANGKTLFGLPYTNAQFVFDPETGDPIRSYGSGVASRVPLPDGSTFLTAGRTDFAAHGDFFVQPDVGAQGDLAAFCAALSP